MRCAEYFPYSTYFEGKCSSAMPNSVYNQIGKSHENGSASHPGAGKISDSIASNGKLEAFKDLTIWTWCSMHAAANAKLQYDLAGRSRNQKPVEKYL